MKLLEILNMTDTKEDWQVSCLSLLNYTKTI